MLNFLIIALAGIISIVAAALTFFAIWAFWLRRLMNRLAKMEHVLKEIHRSLALYHEKLDRIQQILENIQHDDSQLIQTHLIEMDPNLSNEERERLIRYLRSEGFIP